ncbi:MAG: DUF2924 domain-containing protein [Hoeflea sp.]
MPGACRLTCKRYCTLGTHLVREWNGRTYQVEVLDDGFQLDADRWPRLR